MQIHKKQNTAQQCSPELLRHRNLEAVVLVAGRALAWAEPPGCSLHACTHHHLQQQLIDSKAPKKHWTMLGTKPGCSNVRSFEK